MVSRSKDELIDNKRKRLVPGKVSPRLHVPDHIMKPPYVNSRQLPGIASGPEIHDERGIECMQAAGRLAAQVLEYAGTLVQVPLVLGKLNITLLNSCFTKILFCELRFIITNRTFRSSYCI